MNPAPNLIRRNECRKPFRPARLDRRSKEQSPGGHENSVQLIYAHLPPAMVLATERHLRAQTRIEQRAQELWFAGSDRPGDALHDWLRAEQEVVQELCAAFQHRRVGQPEPGEPVIDD